jgi:hypothetical protein
MDIRQVLDFAFEAASDVFSVLWRVPWLRYLVIGVVVVWLYSLVQKSRLYYHNRKSRSEVTRREGLL